MSFVMNLLVLVLWPIYATLVNQGRSLKLEMETAVQFSQGMKFQLLESAPLVLGNAPNVDSEITAFQVSLHTLLNAEGNRGKVTASVFLK